MNPSIAALGLMIACGQALAAAPASQPSKPIKPIAFDATGKQATGLPHKGGYFEMTVPKALLDSGKAMQGRVG